MTKTTDFHSDEENGANYSIRHSLERSGAAEDKEAKIDAPPHGSSPEWRQTREKMAKNVALFGDN